MMYPYDSTQSDGGAAEHKARMTEQAARSGKTIKPVCADCGMDYTECPNPRHAGLKWTLTD